MVSKQWGAIVGCSRTANKARDNFFFAARESCGGTRVREFVRVSDGCCGHERHLGGIMGRGAFE